MLDSGHLVGQTNTFPPSGNVGIGTVSPTGSLHIKVGTGSRGITLEVAENSPGAQSPMLVWDARPGGADYLFYLKLW